MVAAKPVAMCAAVAASLSAASPLAFPVFTAAAILPVTLAYINPVYSFSVGYGLSVAASAGILLKSASISGILLPATVSAAHIGRFTLRFTIGHLLSHSLEDVEGLGEEGEGVARGAEQQVLFAKNDGHRRVWVYLRLDGFSHAFPLSTRERGRAPRDFEGWRCHAIRRVGVRSGCGPMEIFPLSKERRQVLPNRPLRVLQTPELFGRNSLLARVIRRRRACYVDEMVHVHSGFHRMRVHFVFDDHGE